MTTPLYDARFYATQRGGSRSSAAVIVPIVVGWLRPRSVVDVGCGVGAWLGEFARRGVTDVTGVDGAYVDRAELEMPSERFHARDLAQPLGLARTFDLVVSLEVAEHLPAASADAFVDSLVTLGPVVLFSAAIPGQGGLGHVNEAWPEAWARRFARHGYRWADPLRPLLWNEPAVDPWYAQNTLLFHRADAFSTLPWGESHGPTSTTPWPLPLVHPGVFGARAFGGRHAVRRAWRALRHAVKARIFGPRSA